MILIWNLKQNPDTEHPVIRLILTKHHALKCAGKINIIINYFIIFSFLFEYFSISLRQDKVFSVVVV